MKSADPTPPSAHEQARLDELARHGLLDTTSEECFDDAVALVSTLCDTPIALLTLVDHERQWFKASVGVSVRQTARDTSVCSLAIEQRGLFVINDLAADDRTAGMSLVTGPDHFRFYAGVPLVTAAGLAIGSLCAIDTEARPQGLTTRQCQNLLAVGRSVVALLDARHQSHMHQFYRGLVDSASDTALIATDTDTNITVWSRGAQTLFGWSAAEAAGRPISMIFTPEDRAEGRPQLEKQLVCKDGHANDERWHMRKDGSRFYAHGTVTLMDGDLGSGFVKCLRDITADKLAEDRRQAVLELQDALRESADVDDLLKSAATIVGRTLDVNRVGYGTLDATGTFAEVAQDWHAPGLASLVGRHDVRDFGGYGDRLARGDTIKVTDVGLDKFTDAARFETIGARAMLNIPLMERGKLVALFYLTCSEPHEWSDEEVGFAREIAYRTRQAVQRRRAEAALEKANRELSGEVNYRIRERERLWRMSVDMMLVSNLDGMIREVNDAWSKILGWREDELVGTNLFDLIHPDDLQRTGATAIEIGKGRTFPRFENRYRAKDGSYRWIAWTAGQAESTIIAIGRDFTEQRATEERLRQSQKMEAIGQLTGGIAHDFNNMLTGITGSLELLRPAIRSGRTDRIERYIDTAMRSAQRAAALTQRLLAFSRRQSLDVQATDINHLVGGMEELLRRTLGAGILLHTALDCNVWAARTDANQLESALLNLTINARDAMPDGGQLTIETTNTHLDADYVARIPTELTPGDYVVLAVSDTGTGMTRDVMAKAFDPFFTTKPIGQGTGLGLSMIYGFAKQSGGHVSAYSEPGCGTTFKIYLPRDDKFMQASANEVPSLRVAEAGETVMLVEDDPAIQLLVADTLESLGYRVEQASDGHEAVALLEKSPGFDLLITDVGLPGLNGRQVAEMARERFPGLKVLFMTGYAETAAVRGNFLDEGMEMITKPFPIDMLANKIREMIET